MNPNLRAELYKFTMNINSLEGRVLLPGAASTHPVASDVFALPAGTMPREYDPIVAAYRAMEAKYEQPQFDAPVTPPQQAKTSEARFTDDDAGTDAVLSNRLQNLNEIQEAIDLVKTTENLPEFAREYVDETVPEPDSAEPLEDMDSLLMPTEFAVPPDETPEPQPPMSAEGFPSLEQIVQAEMPGSMPAMPAQSEYDAALMTPQLLEQALQQASATTPPQPEDPEEQLRQQQEFDQFLNPYHALLYNPFGMPGPG